MSEVVFSTSTDTEPCDEGWCYLPGAWVTCACGGDVWCCTECHEIALARITCPWHGDIDE